MDLPPEFSKVQLEEAAMGWKERVERAAAEVMVGATRTDQSIETIAGTRLQAEVDWYQAQLLSSIRRERMLVERIHRLTEAA